MSNYVRRLVSGNKARFRDQQLNLELDLVYLTDHIIIMGFPAAGMEGWYRNPREEVKRFLDSRHGDKYRVFNFCPNRENSYPASVFEGRVSRYPFPDHHAPPVGILALATKEMKAWLGRSPDHVVVLHCKAGKGRSGTLACSLVLALEEPVSPPKLQRSYNMSEWADNRANEVMQEIVSETDAYEPIPNKGEESDVPSLSDNESHDTAKDTKEKEKEKEKEKNDNTDTTGATSTEDSKSKQPEQAKGSKEKDFAAKPKASSERGHSSEAHLKPPERNDHGPKVASTVEKVLQLHTSRRMKKATGSQGVSIASQRRWLRYWSEILHGVGPAQLRWLPTEDKGGNGRPPKARLYSIKVRMTEGGGGATIAVVRMANMLMDRTRSTSAERDRGAGNVWVSIARYEDTMVEEIERRVREGGEPTYEADGITNKDDMFADTKWDAKKMVQSFARMGMVHGAKPEVTKSLKDGSIISYDLRPIPSSEWLNVASNEDDSATTTSVEMNDGVVLDSAREFRAKLYMGQVFMGWMWFIPCFHLEQPPSRDAPKTVITLTRSEVDFPLGFGALLVDVELTLGWDLDTMEEEAPRQPDRSASGHETEPHTQGVIAAMGGDVNALQASKD